jgi:hypothetical protein
MREWADQHDFHRAHICDAKFEMGGHFARMHIEKKERKEYDVNKKTWSVKLSKKKNRKATKQLLATREISPKNEF